MEYILNAIHLCKLKTTPIHLKWKTTSISLPMENNIISLRTEDDFIFIFQMEDIHRVESHFEIFSELYTFQICNCDQLFVCFPKKMALLLIIAVKEIRHNQSSLSGFSLERHNFVLSIRTAGWYLNDIFLINSTSWNTL